MRENRQQEIRMDILVDGFRIEQNRRSDADFARICQGYAKERREMRKNLKNARRKARMTQQQVAEYL